MKNRKHNLGTFKNKLYDNCSIFAPDGLFVGRCNEKRIRWYLRKNLAVLIGDNPKQIRLLFEPADRKGANDLFNKSAKENKCVVCGSPEQLSQHHLIPSSFTRLMPDIYMENNSHDVLAVCFPCHMAYEIHANQKRLELANQFGVSTELDKIRNKIIGLSRAYLEAPNDEVKAKIKGYISEIGDIDVNEYAVMSMKTHRNRSTWLCREIVDKITDIQAFFESWREHFLTHAHPKYLPEGWDVHRKVRGC